MRLAGRVSACFACAVWVRSAFAAAIGHGGDLAAVQHPGRQDAAEAVSAGRGVPDGTPGEINAGLAGRLNAIFCAASYDGPVVRKLHGEDMMST